MFSIFAKLKPAESPTDKDKSPIQGPEAAKQGNGNGDDFIFVERRPDAGPITSPTGGMMYPPMPQTAYGPMPYPPPVGNRAGGMAVGPTQHAPIHYLQDIPFELSPQLTSKERFNGTQSQVDGILAVITRQLSIDELAEEYTFNLERSVQNECY
ncbi:CG15891 [Drosophila busckii]|uniref:CG15891 n=1 Tax=Drosophila busckii TaxID=30019 RepID=A0A0M4EMP1_DROBS|nr:uncharacterized protein LOC108607098 [Drosophila busckii]ALC49058.1 CG15891 [Drosophila busckii]